MEIKIPVIQVTQRLGTFYVGSINVRDVVRISYADVRRIEQRDVERYLGIQRPLEKKRVYQIKNYLKSPDATFPTGIVLSVDHRCTEIDNLGNLILQAFEPEFSDDEKIPLNKIGKILDGQHRIAAFMNDDGSFDDHLSNIIGDFQLNVNIFVGIDIDEQANIFATVNLAQTKVNRSLAYDLEGLSKTRSPFKTCHEIAVALDSVDSKSPLYHRIKRLGVKTKGRELSEPLTQAVFVEALVKLITTNPFEDRIRYLNSRKLNPPTVEDLKKCPFRQLFIEQRDSDIALILWNYFTAISETWTIAWNDRSAQGNILPRSNAFKAFMRYLKEIYVEIASGNWGMIPSVKDFKDYFSHIQAIDIDFTSGNFRPGSGGESAFYKLLTGQITIEQLKN